MNAEAFRPSPATDATALAIGIVAFASGGLAAGADRSLAWALVSAIVLLIILNARNLPRRIAVIAVATGSMALVFLPFAEQPIGHIAEGLKIGGVFVSLMASVSLLAAAARRSALVRRIAKELMGRGPRLWGIPMVTVAHFFPALLNIAGTVILCEMAAAVSGRKEDEPPGLTQAVYSTIHRGFVAASCWSPMFGNLALLLLLYPTLEWPDVALYGLAAGVLCSVMSLLIGPLRGLGSGDGETSDEIAALLRALAPLVPMMVVFLGSALLLHRLLGVSVAVVIIAQAPVFALLWHLQSTRTPRAAAGRLFGDMRRLLPRMAPEAIFFASAGCMMALLAAALPEEIVRSAAAALAGSPGLAIGFLLGVNLALGMVGVHPVLTALLLATTVRPELLDLSPLVHFLAILVGWAVSFSISPFTLLSMMLSRYLERSPFEVAYRWNALFALGTMIPAGALLWLLDRILAGGA